MHPDYATTSRDYDPDHDPPLPVPNTVSVWPLVYRALTDKHDQNATRDKCVEAMGDPAFYAEWNDNNRRYTSDTWADNLIAAVKRIRQFTCLGLQQSKAIYDSLLDDYGKPPRYLVVRVNKHDRNGTLVYPTAAYRLQASAEQDAKDRGVARGDSTYVVVDTQS